MSPALRPVSGPGRAIVRGLIMTVFKESLYIYPTSS